MQQTNKIACVIPYHKNSVGLVYTLTMLQNQTVRPDRIIIIDTSSDKSGLAITKMFAYHEVEIVVECLNTHIYTAWNRGIELAEDMDTLIINDDIIFPINFIQTLHYALKQTHSLVLVPETVDRTHISNVITMNYSPTAEGPFSFTKTVWMPGFCFLITRKGKERVGVFNDKKYDIWFGDDDYQNRAIKWGHDNDQEGITKINGLFVYHYGGRSYRYKDPKTLKVIAKDRTNYLK